MYRFSRILLTFSVLLFMGCAGQSNYQLFQTDANTSTSNTLLNTSKSITHTAHSIEYDILPQDRLDVVLYKDPQQESLISMEDLGQSINKNGVLVDTAGYIVLPLVGKIKVAGLSQSGAAARITKAYKKYINTPSVYLEVLNKRLFILGEVKNPGVIKIDKEKMTLLEALAFAGDLTDSAVRNHIVILSTNKLGKGMNIRSVDLTKFDQLDYNSMMLRPNDIVYVEPNSWKAFRVASDDYTSIFRTMDTVLSPFLKIKDLNN